MMVPKHKLTALQVSLTYVVIASVWILFSDKMLVALARDPELIGKLSTFKGWFFVGVTGAILYVALRGILASEAQKTRDLEREEYFLRLQKETLESLVKGIPLIESLNQLLRGIEAHNPKIRAAILLADAGGTRLLHGAAPSLPDFFVRTIDGMAIGPMAASCGTAAQRKSPVFVADLAADPLWADFREPALKCGLRACWSTPILDEQNKVLGTFDFYLAEPGLPTDKDRRLLELVTSTVTAAFLNARAERILRESEARFRFLFANSPTGFLRQSEAGIILDVNEALARMTGYPPEELIGQPVEMLVPPDRIAEAGRQRQQVLAGGVHVREVENRKKSGELFHVKIIESCITFPDGHREIFCNATDATERKRAELEQSRLAAIVESSSDAIISKSLDGIVTSWNYGAEKIFGYTALEAVGKHISFLLPTDRKAEESQLLARIIAGQTIEHFETVRVRKDGKLIDVFVTISPVKDRTGKIIGAAKIARDITEPKRAAERAALHQARFKILFDAIPIGIALHTTHPDGTITRDINSAHLRICGLSRAEHDQPDIYQKITHPDDHAAQAKLRDQVASGAIKNYSMEKRYLRPDGKQVWVNFTYQREIYPDGSIEELTTVTDITQHKQLEEQLRHSQKMDALGKLSGGVAHDFNNLLTIIQGNASLLLLPDAGPADIAESAEQIASAAERAANLTRQLLAFSRNQPLRQRDLDLNELVGGTGKMLERLLGEQVHLEIACTATPLPVHADEGTLDQVLINLSVNARDAMPAGGTLTIQTSRVDLNAQAAAQMVDARPGAFARIIVSDTGCGIPHDILPKIFEPFFTTKEFGKGTGLGLATVYGILQQHRGWIHVESQPGRGASFAVYIPIHEHALAGAAAPAARFSPDLGGRETILLSEDDDALRVLIKNALAKLGYRVIAAEDAAAALALWQENRGRVDLLLTDLMMPGELGGFDLAKQIQQDAPGLKVIYMSGYSPDIAGRGVALKDGVNFLPKPFDIQKLTQTIRNRLNAGKI